MSQHFVKVFPGFFYGSFADTPPFAKLVLLALCLEASPDGVVQGPARKWAGIVGISLSEAEEALRILESPDPISRTPDCEGRRLVPQGAYRWKIVNYEKYRDAQPESIKEYWKQNKAKQRAKAGGAPTPATEDTTPSPSTKESAPDPIQALIDSCSVKVKEPLLRWIAYRKERKIAPYKETGLKALIAAMSKMQDCADAVEFSISMNYQGLFERGRGPALNGKAPELTMREKHEADMAELSRRHGFDD